jgi:hypothetical protein
MCKKSEDLVAFVEGMSLAAHVRYIFGDQQEIAVRRSTLVAERRGWDRIPISIPFFVRGTNPGGEEFLEFATALNLSAGGLLLATRRYLDPGTQISLEVPVALVNKAQLPRSVSLLHATVLRCTPDRQYFLLGLQFTEPLLRAEPSLETAKSPNVVNVTSAE